MTARRETSRRGRVRVVTIFAAALCLGAPVLRGAVFSGEIRANDAQPIFTPPSNSAPVVLRYFVADGATVNAGDVVLRIDPGTAAMEIRKLQQDIEEAHGKMNKEAGDLRVKASDAELDWIDAEAALATAKVDAALPKRLISALDFDRYQAELERAERDCVLKRRQLDEARAAVVRRLQDGRLEQDKRRIQLEFDQTRVDAAEVRATAGGIVVHGFNAWFGNGGRYEEGSSSFPGQAVGEVVRAGSVHVRAYVLEPDRRGLDIGTKLQLAFDALAGQRAGGTITALSGASEAKPEWGNGHYFAMDIDIDPSVSLPFKPGMSVRVDTAAEPAPATSAAVDSGPVRADGEVFAQSTAAISPPQIDNLWQLTITQMADDGSAVKKGDSVVTFDGGELTKELSDKQSELTEKLHEQERLRLELAEKARKESLATAEAAAAAIKAQRKANQPEAYVPGVELKKLLIAKRKAQVRLDVARRRETEAAAERQAEQGVVDTSVVRLRGDVARIQASVAQLSVTAARDGIFLHGSGWDGEKIDVGKQIWRGQSVGEIPDTRTLAVRATLPERDLARVRAGDAVRVMLDGGAGQSLAGHVETIGLSVHSKSRVEPVPVVDLLIVLDPSAVTLKPGQPVRVEMASATQAAAP